MTSAYVATGDAILATYKRAPMRLVRGEGVELFDDEGRAYLDFGSGISVNALGYGDEGLREAMHAAADGLIHVSNLYRTEPGESLARWFVEHSFADRVFFCNSGAEANEGAFKFARRWARLVGGAPKHEIVALRGAFHGRLFASLAATDRPQYRLPYRPLAGGITIAERDLHELEAMLEAETVAAVILEPVQGEGGVRVLDPGFLREVRALTRERKIALILDEIQCGLGRTGWLFAHERSGITPDLMTLAKPMAGGLPMGAVLVSSEIACAVQPGDHGTTFGGGPFVAAVARYVVERISDQTLLASVRSHGVWLENALNDMQQRRSDIRAVRGVGLMWGIDTVQPAAGIIERARERGLLVLSAGEHTVRLLPPLTIGRDELIDGLQRLEASFS
ncbi:MAG TPA: acetylornithine/succinylornithine family transaminase [Gemmatimonadaceae bacterium]|nr:acetylornithine/succinylornithine family transaminase [Gemmatimonadaceae bacterium]